MNYWKSIGALESEVVTLREMLHKIPEEGLSEYKTSEALGAYLKKLRVDELTKVVNTGWIAYFKGYAAERTFGFRADIDGLPIKEATGVAFKSVHEGYMHACGHDGHMAIALTFAKWVSDHKEQIKDDIVIIFQPAEEGPGGAEVIVSQGFLEPYKLDAIFGLHLFPELEEGVFGVKDGPIMAMTGELDIHVVGCSAHGAKPHLGVDSIVIAANIVQNLQQIVSRRIDPIQSAVITIGRIEGGERRNIVAGKTRLEGTVRGFDVAVFDVIEEELKKLVIAYEASYDCQVTYELRREYPPVINDRALTEDFLAIVGDEAKIVPPQMLAEDFSFFDRVAPVLFFFLGTRNEAQGFTYGLHHEKFNFTTPILLKAVQVYASLLERYDSVSEI
ncbi:MAG: amidohydrolase [Clostridia bacterium]|nr:amidohydrolase [Clostridia bacterium]